MKILALALVVFVAAMAYYCYQDQRENDEAVARIEAQTAAMHLTSPSHKGEKYGVVGMERLAVIPTSRTRGS
ncbi:unnamed protein product [Sphagnum jensenii]|uniref:Uncharacterized protein n=1 Tax=Sphagnum jensenii TaxID=128206 RepID=A0ABP0V6M9_9BRYO